MKNISGFPGFKLKIKKNSWSIVRGALLKGGTLNTTAPFFKLTNITVFDWCPNYFGPI